MRLNTHIDPNMTSVKHEEYCGVCVVTPHDLSRLQAKKISIKNGNCGQGPS